MVLQLPLLIQLPQSLWICSGLKHSEIYVKNLCADFCFNFFFYWLKSSASGKIIIICHTPLTTGNSSSNVYLWEINEIIIINSPKLFTFGKLCKCVVWCSFSDYSWEVYTGTYCACKIPDGKQTFQQFLECDLLYVSRVAYNVLCQYAFVRKLSKVFQCNICLVVLNVGGFWLVLHHMFWKAAQQIKHWRSGLKFSISP